MIKSKKLLALGLAGGLVFAACGDDDDSSSDTTAEASDTTAAGGDTTATTEGGGGETVDGAACEVTDVGGVDDRGFNQLAFEGAQEAETQFGIEARVLESTSDADYSANIQSFVDEGCDIIITVGFLLGDATAEFAGNNPDQQFAIVDVGYDPPIDNVRTLNFGVGDPSFVAGYLAAGMTETGTVATYGGVNIPPVTVFMDGFVNGVAYYNEQKGTEVVALGWDGSDGTFAGNFENLDDGERIASSFADEGADIIFPVAGPVGLGSASFASEDGSVRIIGVDNDMFEADPANASVYLTSVLKKIDVAVFDAIETVVVNGEPGGDYVGTLENEGVGIAPYHDQEGDVPAELQDEVTALIDALIAGEITSDGS
ncbi:MAG: BMP family ABC transporter substrate-binding protein [Ilumatobacteraceae bacterium]|nr:BMP family ABC transporter substrate-binding protein [Ilumatobacteraceae bacterium]